MDYKFLDVTKKIDFDEKISTEDFMNLITRLKSYFCHLENYAEVYENLEQIGFDITVKTKKEEIKDTVHEVYFQLDEVENFCNEYKREQILNLIEKKYIKIVKLLNLFEGYGIQFSDCNETSLLAVEDLLKKEHRI